MPESWRESHQEWLHRIARAFYQADRLSGTVRMWFGLRAVADSDGNDVVDVYVSPLDAEAADILLADERTRHMQLLESMVPASMLGYQFILKIDPSSPRDVTVTLLDRVGPALQQAGARPGGPGLAS